MKRPEQMTFSQRAYLPEVVSALVLTFGKLLKNFYLHVLHQLGLRKQDKACVTVQYPEEPRAYAARYRGRHRLTIKEDGSARCTACFLCVTACPAHCIHIEAAEHADPKIEKIAARFEIDTLLCVYCGFCVEACPVDAIRMDTGLHPEIYPPERKCFVENKETLLQRSRQIKEHGQESLYREHIKKIKRLELDPFDVGLEKGANATVQPQPWVRR